MHRFLCFVQLIDDRNVVALTVLSNFIESCVRDISETDEQTVEQAIQKFDISVEIETIFSVHVKVIIDEVVEQACPGQPVCSGHGECKKVKGESYSACDCDKGLYIVI